MRPRFDRAIWTYGAAVIAAVVATLLRFIIEPLVGDAFPFATFFLGSILVAWYWGFWPAALSIFISALAGTYFFTSPATTSPFYLSTRTDRVTVLGFVLGSLVVTALLSTQRGTLKRLQLEVVIR